MILDHTIKFSIVMPVYNVSKYLKTAIDSIIAQTYEQWELILVNDASTDDSLTICQMYAEKDSRIHLLNKKTNEGLSKARNSGMRYVTGNWIIFIDSDDYLDTNTLECLLKTGLSDKSDVILFGYMQEYEDEDGKIKRLEISAPKSSELVTGSKIADLVIQSDYDRLFSYAWNKVYRTSFIQLNALQFEPIKMIEDYLFNINVFTKAKQIQCIPEAYYHYRKPPHETLASQYIEEFYVLCLRRLQEEQDLLKQRNRLTQKNMELLSRIHIKHIFSALVRITGNAQMSTHEKCLKIKFILNTSDIYQSLQNCTVKNFKYRLLKMIMCKKMCGICFFATWLYTQLSKMRR